MMQGMLGHTAGPRAYRLGYARGADDGGLLDYLKTKLATEKMDLLNVLTGGQVDTLKAQMKEQIAKAKGKKPEDVTDLEIAEYLAQMPTGNVAAAVKEATERKLGDIATAIVAAAVIGGLFYYLGRRKA